MFGGIVFGSFCDSGMTYLPNLMLVLGSLLLVYVSLTYIFKNRNWNLNFPILDKISIRKVEIILLVASALVVVTHYVAIGHVPVLRAFLSSDYNEIVNIRKVIAYDTPVLSWYLCHIFLKACFPVLTFYFFYTKRAKMGWIVLLVGMFYGFSMMQKSYALSIPLPTLILFVLRFRVWSTLIIVGLIVLQIFGLLYITNPDLREQMQVFEKETANLDVAEGGAIEARKAVNVPNDLKKSTDTTIDKSSIEKNEVKVEEKTQSNLKKIAVTTTEISNLEKVEHKVETEVNNQNNLKKSVVPTVGTSSVEKVEDKTEVNDQDNLKKSIGTAVDTSTTAKVEVNNQKKLKKSVGTTISASNAEKVEVKTKVNDQDNLKKSIVTAVDTSTTAKVEVNNQKKLKKSVGITISASNAEKVEVKTKVNGQDNLKKSIGATFDTSTTAKVEVNNQKNLKKSVGTTISASNAEKVEVKTEVNDQSNAKKGVRKIVESSNVKESEVKIDENYLSNLRKGINTSSSSITNRIFLLPGAMVNSWFKVIPEKKPFLNGRGYRFLAPFHGEKGYEDYNQLLYRLIYPGFAKRGFQGNVNVASFMYEYANFGRWGLVLGGVLIGLALFFIEKIFEGFGLVKLALNGMFVFFLSSIAYTTLLFSGGWVFTVLLFLILKKRFKNEY